jgi:phosphorylase kinase alpha/beta subunit
MKDASLQSALDRHFDAVEKIILSRQDPITGLLPASTAVNAHGDYTDAWVRDNVYSILSVWGLSLAYRRHFGEHHRTHLLSQSVVKLMRGLLSAMMRQSDRVERFKYSLKPIDALHAKYGTKTGLAVVGDDEWGHLQIDATSIFLLMLAQMTASGLRIIYTMDEVDFVQNLVHYISRSYCTPDYGIWERGNKINKGTPEINCSSVGMAKAALEAMDGFNLFGNVASEAAVIHVVQSDIARARFTLLSLLPRESVSKETDAALLSIIGYPAYAVEDRGVVEKTRGKIIKKLCGRYGCKRFLLDGHQSVLEDTSRLYYEAHELRKFEHIESEWPLFFTYLLLDALMRGDREAAARWQEKLAPLFVEENGQQLLPELYIVPEASIEAEKAKPGSQERVPNENIPLVWAQSLYMLSSMIEDGILRAADIDPLHRHERIGYRRNTQVLVPVIAQNEHVREKLLELGFSSETPEEIKPIYVRHASELSRVYTILGKNSKLGLSGRPELVARTITTSQLYLIDGEENLFLPYYFDPKGFYFSYDNTLLVEHFRTSMAFLSSNWDKPGQPIVPFLVREDMLLEKDRDAILSMLHQIQTGSCDGITLRTGRAGQLLTTVATERFNDVEEISLEKLYPSTHHLRQVNLLSCAGSEAVTLGSEEIHWLESLEDEVLVYQLLESENRHLQAYAIELLWRRRGADFMLYTREGEVRLSDFAEALYAFATLYHDWAVVRRLAQVTGKFDDRLEDVLLDIVIRQKRLAVGRAYFEKAIFTTTTDNQTILETIDAFCGENPAEGVLTQETILHLGYLVRTHPELFENMLTLRTWHFVQLLVGQIARERRLSMGEAYEALLELAPHTIYAKLRKILEAFAIESKELLVQENLQLQGVSALESEMQREFNEELGDLENWRQWREQAGMIGRLSPRFYKDIWYMLQRCSALVIGEKYHLRNRIGSELTLESTAGEQSFALKIDTLLQGIEVPDYRQLNIEIIETLSRLFRQNPDLRIESDLILDVLIGHAVRISWEKRHPGANYNEERGKAWEAFYHISPKEADQAFVEAFIYLTSSVHNEDKEEIIR